MKSAVVEENMPATLDDDDEQSDVSTVQNTQTDQVILDSGVAAGNGILQMGNVVETVPTQPAPIRKRAAEPQVQAIFNMKDPFILKDAFSEDIVKKFLAQARAVYIDDYRTVMYPKAINRMRLRLRNEHFAGLVPKD